MFLGSFPHVRHDDTAWRKTDKRRAKLAGKSMAIQAVLVEVRGDWKFFDETFGFPKHNTLAGCCWKCECTPNEVPSQVHVGTYIEEETCISCKYICTFYMRGFTLYLAPKINIIVVLCAGTRLWLYSCMEEQTENPLVFDADNIREWA